MSKLLIFVLIFVLLISCSSSETNELYPKEVTSEMYSLCLQTFRYGYCKCYVDNWQKKISYDEYIVLKPQIDSGNIIDEEINLLLENLHKDCGRLPTSSEGF